MNKRKQGTVTKEFAIHWQPGHYPFSTEDGRDCNFETPRRGGTLQVNFCRSLPVPLDKWGVIELNSRFKSGESLPNNFLASIFFGLPAGTRQFHFYFGNSCRRDEALDVSLRDRTESRLQMDCKFFGELLSVDFGPSCKSKTLEM